MEVKLRFAGVRSKEEGREREGERAISPPGKRAVPVGA